MREWRDYSSDIRPDNYIPNDFRYWGYPSDGPDDNFISLGYQPPRKTDGLLITSIITHWITS